MAITSIQENHYNGRAQKICKNVGKISGFGLSSAYVAKNYKNVYSQMAEEVAIETKGKRMAATSACCAIFVGASMLAGKIIGSFIGKQIDKHNQTPVEGQMLCDKNSKNCVA